jgi:hypothetical protein
MKQLIACDAAGGALFLDGQSAAGLRGSRRTAASSARCGDRGRQLPDSFCNNLAEPRPAEYPCRALTEMAQRHSGIRWCGGPAGSEDCRRIPVSDSECSDSEVVRRENGRRTGLQKARRRDDRDRPGTGRAVSGHDLEVVDDSCARSIRVSTRAPSRLRRRLDRHPYQHGRQPAPSTEACRSIHRPVESRSSPPSLTISLRPLVLCPINN